MNVHDAVSPVGMAEDLVHVRVVVSSLWTVGGDSVQKHGPNDTSRHASSGRSYRSLSSSKRLKCVAT